MILAFQSGKLGTDGAAWVSLLGGKFAWRLGSLSGISTASGACPAVIYDDKGIRPWRIKFAHRISC